MARTRFPLAALQYNLNRLLFIRAIVFGCQIAALLFAYLALDLVLDYRMLTVALAVSAALNIAVVIRGRMTWAVSAGEFLGHLLMDVALLSLLLFYSGGANNPFVSFFLVPISISAAILPRFHTIVMAGTSLLAYSLLLFVYEPLPAVTPTGLHAEHGEPAALNLHILGMWFNFLVSAALITWFVARMAAELRLREDMISRYREANLRNELVLAVATQAAGTAHELGTPLGTAAILLKDMEDEYASQPVLLKDIRLLRDQVARCRDALKKIVSRADFKRENAVARVELREFVQNIVDQWLLLRPELEFRLEVTNTGAGPLVVDDPTLQQAIVNVLNNAADASPARIDVHLEWRAAEWHLRIHDYGTGIDPEIEHYIGTAFVSTKGDGLGVGFIVSQASINLLGGRVSIYPHTGRGTVTEIVIPYSETRNEH